VEQGGRAVQRAVLSFLGHTPPFPGLGRVRTGWLLREVTSNPNLIAVVKGHPEAPHRLMTEVLAELRAAGAERISLQVLGG